MSQNGLTIKAEIDQPPQGAFQLNQWASVIETVVLSKRLSGSELYLLCGFSDAASSPGCAIDDLFRIIVIAQP